MTRDQAVMILNKSVVVVAEKISAKEYEKDLWSLQPDDQKAFLLRAALNCGMDGEDAKRKVEGMCLLVQTVTNPEQITPNDLKVDPNNPPKNIPLEPFFDF